MLKYIQVSFLAIMSVICVFSCSSCDDDDQGVATDQEVNNWIYRTMENVYLWNDKLPTSPNLNQRPDYFFKSILYAYDKNSNPDGDRFSFISSNYEELANELSGVYANEIGFEFIVYYVDASKYNIIGEVLYVKPNTPAAAQGLKRGQFFLKLNGNPLNKDNYLDLFSLRGSFRLTVADDRTSGQTREYTLNTVSNYVDNPNYLDSVYEVDNKKIGYFVYNFFSDDSNNGTQKFNTEMVKVFEKFIGAGVTDLIIDLRYNSGGTLSSATYMASMLVKNRNVNNDFLQMTFNKLQMDYMTEEQKRENLHWKFENEISLSGGGNVALPRVGDRVTEIVFLTGRRTASASEMVINGLLPYNDKITLIGDTTVGKNVGSQTFKDDKNLSRNKWAIQPITVKLSNNNGESDFTAGFLPKPGYLYDENDSPKLALGNREEKLLKAAIGYITGSRTLKSTSATGPAQRPIDSSISRRTRSNHTLVPSFDRD